MLIMDAQEAVSQAYRCVVGGRNERRSTLEFIATHMGASKQVRGGGTVRV